MKTKYKGKIYTGKLASLLVKKGFSDELDEEVDLKKDVKKPGRKPKKAVKNEKVN